MIASEDVQRLWLEMSATNQVPTRGMDEAQVTRGCILVLGMHRSGTSAIARVLNLLGAKLPANVLPPVRDNNETGFWEPRDLVLLHDRMLTEAGSRWDDWRTLDLSALSSERIAYYRHEMKRILQEEFDGAPLVVLKDPRICRFVPLYQDILAEGGRTPLAVLPVRNPLAVSASLLRRDGLPEGFTVLLWLRHVLDAEAATRATPRCVVSYDHLVADWRSVAGRIGDRLGLVWPRSLDEVGEQVNSFLSPDLRHFAPSTDDLERRGDIPCWVRSAYRSLLRLEADETDEQAKHNLDRIREEFASASAALEESAYPALAARNNSIGELRSALDERDKSVGELRSALDERDKSVGELRSALDVRDQSIEKLRSALDTRDHSIEELRSALDTRDKSIEELRSALDARDKSIGELGSALDARDQSIGELRRAALTQQEDLASARTEARELADELAKRTAEIERIVASRSWRLTTPLRKLNSKTHDLPPVGSREFRLRPLRDVQHAADVGVVTEWRITGQDPQFDLGVGSQAPLPAGHYRLIVESVTNGPEMLDTARLYIDSGAGFSEEEAVELRFARGARRRFAASVTLRDGAHALRFDPSDHSGCVALGRAWLQKVPQSMHHASTTGSLAEGHATNPRSIFSAACRAGSALAGGIKSLAAGLRSHWVRSSATADDYDARASDLKVGTGFGRDPMHKQEPAASAPNTSSGPRP